MARAHDHQASHDYDHAGQDNDNAGHDHHGRHDHVHPPGSFGRAFAIGIALNAGFVVLEVVYGLLGNSVALLADAGHNMSDVLGLGVAWSAAVPRPARANATLHLRPRRHIDPGRALQCGLPARDHRRAELGSHRTLPGSAASRRKDGDDRGRRGRPDQWRLRMAVCFGPQGRSQHPRRVHAYGGRRACLRRRRHSRSGDPGNRLALAGPRGEPGHQRHHYLGNLGSLARQRRRCR